MELPVASQWCGVESVDDRILCYTEPHVHPIFSANTFMVQERVNGLFRRWLEGFIPEEVTLSWASPC